MPRPRPQLCARSGSQDVTSRMSSWSAPRGSSDRGAPYNCGLRPATAVAWQTTDTAVSERGQERGDGGLHLTVVGVRLPCDRSRRPIPAEVHFFEVHPSDRRSWTNSVRIRYTVSKWLVTNLDESLTRAVVWDMPRMPDRSATYVPTPNSTLNVCCEAHVRLSQVQAWT